MSFVLVPIVASWRILLDKMFNFNNVLVRISGMGPMHSDGLHYWYEEGVDWANNWVTESKQEFTDALSFICVKCQCRTTISVPKGEPVTIRHVICPVCKEVLLLTTFTALAQ